jgi:hypothetical protein
VCPAPPPALRPAACVTHPPSPPTMCLTTASLPAPTAPIMGDIPSTASRQFREARLGAATKRVTAARCPVAQAMCSACRTAFQTLGLAWYRQAWPGAPTVDVDTRVGQQDVNNLE